MNWWWLGLAFLAGVIAGQWVKVEAEFQFGRADVQDDERGGGYPDWERN